MADATVDTTSLSDDQVMDAWVGLREITQFRKARSDLVLIDQSRELVLKALTDRSLIEEVSKRDFSQAQRDKASDEGAALPDGSFPIYTQKDLENAATLVSHAADPAKARSHAVSRAKSLGLSLPPSLGGSDSSDSSTMSKASNVDCPNCGESVSPSSDTCPSCGHDMADVRKSAYSSFIKKAAKFFGFDPTEVEVDA